MHVLYIKVHVLLMYFYKVHKKCIRSAKEIHKKCKRNAHKCKRNALDNISTIFFLKIHKANDTSNT